MSEHAGPGCPQRDAVIAGLQAHVATLTAQVQDWQAKVRDLETRLGTNACNSSLPPSANPLAAPKPVTQKPTGRKPGAQPGHLPRWRVRLPRPRLHRVIPLIPQTGPNGLTPLPPEAASDDPAPIGHPVAELPKIAAPVLEYQGHARRCPRWATLTGAPIPARIRAPSMGPRWAAVMAWLSGRHPVRRRGVEEIVETVVDVPVSLGTVWNREAEMSQALQGAHAEAVPAVREAPVQTVDETGWKQAPPQPLARGGGHHAGRGLWDRGPSGRGGPPSPLGRDDPGHPRQRPLECLPAGARPQASGLRGAPEAGLPEVRGPGGASVVLGRGGLGVVTQRFRRGYAFRGGGLDRAGLERTMRSVRRDLPALLESGRSGADPATARLGRNLLAVEEALWTFRRVEGVEPTTNPIERPERPAVLGRTNSFGSWSASGCPFVERLWTVVPTLRLHQRPVLDSLHQALVAHRNGQPTPKLLLSE